MPDLPRARTTVAPTANVTPLGDRLIAVLAAVPTHADITPRLFSSTDALLTQHGYNEGLEYVSLHHQDTRLPVLFTGLPIETEGAVGRVNASGNTGTSVVTVAAGSGGAYAETDGVLTIITGGTIGTDQIMLGLSLDGGRTTKRVRLGTANSYVIPHVNITLSFAAGTLVTGNTALTWHSTAPRWNQAGLQAARLALAGQELPVRTWLIIGDLDDSDDADDVVGEANAYHTTHDRFIFARAQLRDRLPYAALSQTLVRMTGSPTLTFGDNGGDPDTITRSAGSWITDGVAAGDTVTIVDSTDNDGNYVVVSLTATVLTLATGTLTAEVATAGCTVTAAPTLTFANVGGTGDTITRNRGSWLDDGFRVGDKPAVTGTASNNVTAAVGLTGVTATVLTFDTTALSAEVISSYGVSIVAGETKAQHVATLSAAFASVDAQRRIDLGHGRLRKLSPITGYRMRRPVQWGASTREYLHDVHVACWAKEIGPLPGWSLLDAAGNLVEHDERIDGGALAARFTCARSYANGPKGAFIAMSLTRETEGSLLSLSHNMAVTNIMCAVVQAQTESFIGKSLVLNENGTATTDSLAILQERVNSALRIALLQSKGEGARASNARWAPSPDDVLNVPDATITGVGTLSLRGTIVNVNTAVRIPTAGGQ